MRYALAFIAGLLAGVYLASLYEMPEIELVDDVLEQYEPNVYRVWLN